MTKDLKAEPFNYPENITVGQARVIWAPYREGGICVWHLPGGSFTRDRTEAHGWSVRMDRLMRWLQRGVVA